MNNKRDKLKFFNKRLKISLSLIIVFIILFLGYRGVVLINSWFNSHYFQFNKVLAVTWKKPIEIKERKLEITEIVNIVNQIPTLENLEPIEQYICEKWGVYDCKTALAIARAESGMKEEAVNINSNNTIDIGIFQINSVHFKKEGCGLKDLVDQYKNVDCAYKIYENQGWNPWVVWKTGIFKDNY